MNTTFIGLVDPIGKSSELKHVQALTTTTDFTMDTSFDGVTDRIITPVNVYDVYREKAALGVKALWDTGSRTSCISERLARELKLSEIGRMTVISPTGTLDKPIHRVELEFSEHLVYKDIAVTEYPLERHDCDVLIGMDIITKGRFLVETIDGNTHMEFIATS